MIHCGTSYGHYKEIREQLVHHKELRDEVRRILDKMGKPLVIPEEIVHYSEWVYAMRDRFAERQTRGHEHDHRHCASRLPLLQDRR